MTTTRRVLRAATRPDHDAVDAALGALHRPADAGEYGAALARLRRAWAALEVATDRWYERHTDVIDWPARRRLAELDADLRALGIDPPAAAALDVSDGSDGEPVARGLGRLYVLEGSTLGAAAIAHRLRDDPATATLPRTFFERGAHPDGRWARFLQVLDAHVADEPSIASAVDGAREAFAVVRAAATDRLAVP